MSINTRPERSKQGESRVAMLGKRLDDSDDSDDLVRPAIKRVCARSCSVVGEQSDTAVAECLLTDICYELHVSGVPAGMQHVTLEDVTHECDARRLRVRAQALMSGLAHPENAAAVPPLEASRSTEAQRELEEWGLFGATPPREEDRA